MKISISYFYQNLLDSINSFGMSISHSLSLPLQVTHWNGRVKLSLFINFNKTHDNDFI